MEKIELKYLAPYLPYGLKVSKLHTLNCGVGIGSINHLLNTKSNNYKPILRPLTDLEKKIEIDGEIMSVSEILPSRERDDIPNPIIGYWSWNAMQILFEYHFDVFGLIEKGLAIDINSLPKEDNNQ